MVTKLSVCCTRSAISHNSACVTVISQIHGSSLLRRPFNVIREACLRPTLVAMHGNHNLALYVE